jgi:hypothetical protein
MLTAVPLVAAMLPGVITPEPPLNTPVKLELDPDSIADGLAAKLVIDAGGVVVVVELPVPQPAKSKMAALTTNASITEGTFRFMIASICATEFGDTDGSISGRSERAGAR